MRILVRETDALVRDAAVLIAGALEAAVRERGRGTIALSGGSTPKAVYRALATGSRAIEVDWRDVDVFFGDERAVPPDHPDSNYRMAKESLLDAVEIPAANVHRMEGERQDLDAAATDYGRLLPERLDVLLLGMGPDGHTASLFPGSPALDARHPVVAVLDAPKPPPRRLTITPPVIEQARDVVVLATGAEKAAMVSRALEGAAAPREVPIQLARGGIWFLDPAAASRLRERA